MDAPFPYTYIAIEGNIGAGKTTLCQRLADDYGFQLILEQFADNPFLPYFYEQPERYAFPVELFFMTERHKQLQTTLSRRDLFQQHLLADYFFVKTLLFAGANLNAEEYRLFQRLYYILNATFPKPELLVYLHRPVEVLLTHIRLRGRAYEQGVGPDYLLRIQHAYFDYFRTVDYMPVVIVDAGNMDFLSDQQHYSFLLDILRESFQPGIHRRSLITE